MEVVGFGKENSRKIVLIPGFGHGEIIAHRERMAAEIKRVPKGGAACSAKSL